MAALGGFRMQQYRPKWAVIQSEGDKDRQIDNTQHKVHQGDTANVRTAPQQADYERP